MSSSLCEKCAVFFPFLGGLSEASRRRLDTEGSLVTARRGDELLMRGAQAQGAYLVLSGQLDVYIVGTGGREQTLYRVGNGEACLFALDTAFSGVAYPAWVRVTSPEVRILLIPGGLVRDLHERERCVRDWVFRVQSSRLIDLVSAMEETLACPLEQRLRSYLVRTANGEGQLAETHESIAAYLGTAREVVTRHLRTLSDAGLVTLSRGRITVLDRERLGGE